MSTVSTVAPGHVIRLIAADIKLHHSVFALPFAVLAAFMAAPWTPEKAVSDLAFSTEARSRFAGQIALVILAMVLARTAAMLANRLLDRDLDAKNPRTAGRAIPSGRLPISRAVAALVFCAVGFMLVCATFGWMYENWWPTILGLPVLGWISLYPLAKRFTAMCHLWLGASLAVSPLAAAIAIDPAALGVQPSLWLLAAMVLCWVAGFDIIYALQDVEIDRRDGLHSVPQRFGRRGGLWISRALHIFSAGCLYACWRVDPRFGAIFGIGVGIAALLLVVEHVTVARHGTARIVLAFFTLNGIISCLLGTLGVLDVLSG